MPLFSFIMLETEQNGRTKHAPRGVMLDRARNCYLEGNAGKQISIARIGKTAIQELGLNFGDFRQRGGWVGHGNLRFCFSFSLSISW